MRDGKIQANFFFISHRLNNPWSNLLKNSMRDRKKIVSSLINIKCLGNILRLLKKNNKKVR